MDCESSSKKILVLRKQNEVIDIIPCGNGDHIVEKEYVALEKFFHIVENNICDTNLALDKISTLDLSRCNLENLPDTCKDLNIKKLVLAHNNLSKVPVCIYSGMTYIEHLDIGHNKIEQFYIAPACLNVLKVLKINNNSFKSLPQFITNFQCTELEEINFSCNNSTSYKFAKLSCTVDKMKLKKVKFKNSCLLDADYEFLRCFNFIEYLDLSNKYRTFLNTFYETDNLFLNLKWKHLKVLKMNNLSIDMFPDGICWVETLEELYINNNSISWLPDGIRFLVNLKVLDVSSNLIVAIPQQVEKLVSLEVLLASRNSIDTILSNMPALKVLDLYDNSLDSINIDCDKLEELDLELNYFSTNEVANYEDKKNRLRTSLKQLELRADGIKILEKCPSNRSSYCSRSSSTSINDNYCNDIIPTVTLCDETEDWDLPVPSKPKNPDIDSADEEWTGVENYHHRSSCKVDPKVYVHDEDWMFEDAE
ncbi:malignant fibrous histiocytoma-amplified sequence 1 homolog [Diabrotica virgifera virgifera]|uniref:Malignant fibrous histiocytoma-amplified sequence 1 homolog n=1 Tax=Diabrotica virgifera virgifera TaxID=50390 RepID=A0A6P7GCI0_DIAVI|nr:malignant fibrous histiocytoma-amplified sequence 1 homolog [Diabrotica virgifera virgifera]